ncbi:hypothetical protein O6H91_01G141900 [Diphasiastrum complanatum]|nr:hypothetical protein O6H91_01G060500 [Diphasiastrum complanatum]KAJ7570954.1 hypothetical protein O6H91_01G141900 [Diphasiastrum complanatum]KAJ7570955.1 hypothetical protein O6H91_01G141900 [Diphasiastrum complanatum]
MTSTPEEAKFVLASRHRSFRACYPTSIQRVLNDPSWEGDFHSRIRKIIQTPMLPESLQLNIGKFDSLVRVVLTSWEKSPYIITHDETRKLAFNIALYVSCTLPPSDDSAKMLEDYGHLSIGTVSLPFDIPGTRFHVALKKSKEILARLNDIIISRRMKKVVYDDILSSLMESTDKNGKYLSNNEIRDILITFIFAGHETTAVFLVWIVKYLTDNPDILEQVKTEQCHVKMSKSENEPLSWCDLKNMPLTSRVVQETLRLSNVAPFSPREVIEDVEYKGVFIPKGWKVQVYYRHFHLSPEYYKDPYKFDPSRFELPLKPSIYMPFGNGVRLCPGSELVKLEALLFVHNLVTTYSWKIVGQDRGTQYWPTPRPRGGLRLEISKIVN